MDITRRDWQLLNERVSRMESKLYQLDSALKNMENLLRPENLLRRLEQAKEEAKLKDKQDDIFRSPLQ